MQILNVEQGSPEWIQARAGLATASNFSKIVTSKGDLSKSIKEYGLVLASQTLVDEVEPSFKNGHMARGNDLEFWAVDAYEEYTFDKVERVGFMKCDGYGYSPDGLVGENGLIEVKCPMQKVHLKYIAEGVVPLEYYQQIQGALFVSGREWCDFVSYNPTFKGKHKLFIKRVFRDEHFIAWLEIGIRKVIAIRDEYL